MLRLGTFCFWQLEKKNQKKLFSSISRGNPYNLEKYKRFPQTPFSTFSTLVKKGPRVGEKSKNSSYTSKALVDWTKEEVQAWLSSSPNFKNVAPHFSLLNGEALASFTQNNIEVILKDTAQAIALYNALRKLKGETDSAITESVFGPSILKSYQLDESPDSLGVELPFQNREPEIEAIATTCLQNLRVSKLGAGEISQKKTTLLTTAQMWGSGKTWLGRHFLPQFRSQQYKTLRSKLEVEYGSDTVGILANSVYIPIDLRRWMHMFIQLPPGRLDLYILRSLLGTILAYYPQDIDFWQNQPESKWSPGSILNWFKEKYNRSFFIHYDEVDYILQVPPAILYDAAFEIEGANRFYHFWTFIHSVTLTGNFLYISGRSVFLYAFGKGLYRRPGLVSPGDSTCLLMDTLKPQHLENILAINPGIEDKAACKYVASLLYLRTGGVPRFVGYAVEYLLTLGIGKNLKKENISVEMFGDKFRDFVRIKEKARSELNPLRELGDPKIRKLYARLIALSALGVPLDIDATINNPEIWGMHKTATNHYFSVPVLDMLRLYNLWIEKSPTDSQWRIKFPDIVLDEIANFNKLQHDELELLPYWIAFSKTRSAQAWEKGTLLERIVGNSMELAILDKLGIAKQYATFEERFPFLSHSSIAKEIVKLPESPYRQLLKIVTKFKGPGSAAYLETMTNEQREAHLKLLKDHIAKPPSLIQEEKRIYKGDWNYLLKIVQPEVLYIPAPKSASADLIYFATTMNSIHFQFKAEKRPLNMDIIIKEARKTFAAPLVDGKTLTFVMVALNVDLETIKKRIISKNKCIEVSLNNQILSIVLQSEASLKGHKETWQIPHNMDIVILLRQGLEQLITKHNLNLFENAQNVTLEDLVKNKN